MEWDQGKPLEDWEYPEDDSDEESGDSYQCHECGAWVYEDADCCPSCGLFVSPSQSTFGFWRLISILVLVCFLFGLLAAIFST